MKNKRIKYDGRGMHRRAILHMVGQSLLVFGEFVRVSDVASWMNVSKVTATKYLRIMERNEEIIMSKKPYKNTFVYEIQLSHGVWCDFMDGLLHESYQVYAQKVMGIISRDA